MKVTVNEWDTAAAALAEEDRVRYRTGEVAIEVRGRHYTIAAKELARLESAGITCGGIVEHHHKIAQAKSGAK